MVLIEKDNVLSNNLKLKYRQNKNIKVLNNDILKTNLDKILKKDSIIFGNLPYNISSQILVNIIKLNLWPPKYSDLIFMFQKELSERKLVNQEQKNMAGYLFYLIINWQL